MLYTYNNAKINSSCAIELTHNNIYGLRTMPNISLPIEDLHDSVERPVVFSVVREILEITELSDKTPISFYDDEGKAAQAGSLITNDATKPNKWPFDERIRIEVDEDFDPNSIYTIHTKQPENIPVFKDDAIGAVIRPIYSPTKVVINFNYRARDKNQAMKWRNNIRAKVAMFRDINLHELSYHTHLQEEFIIIIKEIHRLRENVAPYGEEFDVYFAKHLSDKASIKTNLGGKSVLWGVEERQIRVQGIFDFEGAPEKGEKSDDSGDAWSINFSYKFEYQKPIMLNMTYPIVIHNQVLSKKFRPSETVYRLEDQKRSFSMSGRAYNNFESDTKVLTYKGNDGISIPEFDEFSPKMILPSTVNVMTCLVVVETNGTNPRKLLNLTQLGEVGLNPIVLDFIKQIEYPFMGKDFYSIFSLSLYRHSGLVESGSLTVDENLDVYSTFDLDLRKTYRVRLGLVTNFTYLRTQALDRIRTVPGLGDILINCIDGCIAKYANHPDIGKSEMSDVDRKLLNASPYPKYDPRSNPNVPGYLPILNLPGRTSRASNIPTDYGRNLPMSTVQSMFVRAQRKED